MTVEIDIQDHATAAVERLGGALSADRLGPMIGAAEVLLFQNHFRSLPDNRQGWPSTGFWGRAARATSWNLTGDGVVVSVNQQGVRQRYFGGVIEPVNAKFLTIPARAEAYGKRASEFNDLVPVFHRVGGQAVPWALVEAPQTTFSLGKRRKDGSRKVSDQTEIGGLVYFWLVKSVNQQADPDVLPSDAEVTETAVKAIEAAVVRALARTNERE